MTQQPAKIGIIGGTGLYDMEDLREVRAIEVETPFGKPSDPYTRGILSGVEVFFLPRHGHGHRLLPSEINHKANIFGFKKLGVSRIISVSAVGSLREDYRPRDVILLDQYFDRTKGSDRHTFFGDGLVAHVTFGEPVCKDLRQQVYAAAVEVAQQNAFREIRVHNGGTYVNMEGPAFSTKAESHFYRQCDFDVIGMTSLAEAKLAREAELCYAPMAMITDYDCWHETAASVTIEMILGHLHANAELAQMIIRRVLPAVASAPACSCSSALANSIVTAPDRIPAEIKRKLEPIVGKYLA